MANPVSANLVLGPTDSSAASPSISWGGSPEGNSGTGLFGTFGQIGFSVSGGQMLSLTASGLGGTGSAYSGASSFQPIGPDLELAAGAGKNVAVGTAFLAPVMGNLIGASLTKTGNYLGGLIGLFSVTGTKASTYPTGAVLAGVADGVTSVDGAVTAFVDGDSAVTVGNAAFKAMCNNSNAGSGFNYGLDLYGASHDGYLTLAILKADIRMSNQVCILNGSGAPTNNVTGLNFAGKGSLYVDYANGKLYITTAASSSPTWVVVGSQS